MTRFLKLTVILFALFTLHVLALDRVAAQERVTLSIATGPTGGVYALLGGGMANILSKYVPGYAVNAESTAGAVANLQLMKQQPSVMAFSTADVALEGFTGQGKFSGGAVPVRTLMVAYPNRMHVITVEGTGINTFADLKGKRVSTGIPNSATEQIAFRVLEAMGLHPEQDIQRERLDLGQSWRRAQRPNARRVLLGRRHPDAGHHRPRRHPGNEAEAHRPRRRGRRDEPEVRPALCARYDSGPVLPGARATESGRHGVEPDRRPRRHARPDGLHHRQDDPGQAR